MRVLVNEDVREIEGVNIETGCHQIRVRLVSADGFNPEAITLRCSLNSPQDGTTVLRDKVSITSLAELTSFGKGEGFFIRTAKVGNPNLATEMEFVFNVSNSGYLALKNGEFLVLDIKAAGGLDDDQLLSILEVYAIDAPIKADTLLKSDSLRITGYTKDINLIGTDSVGLPLDRVERIQVTTVDPVTGATKSTEYVQTELYSMARSMNDVVSVDKSTGALTTGVKRWMELATRNATKMVLTPADGNGEDFDIYLFKNLPR